jgi:hypothetical protein
MQTNKLGSIAASALLASAALFSASSAQASGTSTPTPPPTNGGGTGGGTGVGTSNGVNNINNAATLGANPISNSSSSGSFTNLGGTSVSFDQDSYYSSVRIGAASCPKSNVSFVASSNGIWQDSSLKGFNDTNAYGASAAVVYSNPLTGKDGKRCSEYLQLQVDDLFYSQGLKSANACVGLVKNGVKSFDPIHYGQRVSEICLSIASDISTPQQVVVKEVIKEVPVQVPVIKEIPPVPVDGQKNG